MQVYIDDREKQSRQMKAQLTLPGEPIVTRLECGDYVYGDLVGVEYKSAEDMISSIIANRVFNECRPLRETYKYPYLVIAGSVPDVLRVKNWKKIPGRITVNQYLGAVASLSTIVNVLVTDNENQALTLINRVFEKCEDGKVRNIPRPPVKTVNPAVNYLSSIRGISPVKAVEICSTLGVNCLSDLLTVTVDDLRSVDGVGVRTAENIVKGIKQ